MQVVFESRAPEGAHLRQLAVGRLQFVMRRLTGLVARAKVQFSDINGPRAGVDKRCLLELKTASLGTVVVTAIASDWRSALESALARCARVLTRARRRQRRHQHQRISVRRISLDH